MNGDPESLLQPGEKDLEHTRHLELCRDFLHFLFVDGLGLGGGLLDGFEDGVGDEAGVLLEELGVEGEGKKFTLAVDLDAHGAAAGGGLDFAGRELLLELLHLFLRLLGLFEEFAESSHE